MMVSVFTGKRGGSQAAEGDSTRNRVDVLTHIPQVRILSPSLPPACGPSGWLPPRSLAGCRGGFNSL
jgi:hypothetical protein